MKPAVLSLLTMLLAAPAAAQAVVGQPPAAAFEIAGWRYQLQGRDVHGYICEAKCHPTSRVSYRVYDASFTLTLDEFREQQRTAVKMLEERMPPGGKIEIVSIDEDNSGGMRVLKAQRLHSYANGRKEHVISSFVFGGARPFSLISSADEEAPAKANHAQFLPPVMLAIGVGAAKR